MISKGRLFEKPPLSCPLASWTVTKPADKIRFRPLFATTVVSMSIFYAVHDNEGLWREGGDARDDGFDSRSS